VSDSIRSTDLRTGTLTGLDGGELPVVRPRHWGRTVVAVAALAFLVWFASALVTNDHLRWNRVWEYLFAETILRGVGVTIGISVVATTLGLVLGVLLAVMKLTHNPVLSRLVNAYIWFFRGTPVLVQLIFWYNLAFLFPDITLRIPFTQIGMRWDTNDVMTGFNAAVLGLGLNLAAYFAETVRAGIQAVDKGQSEAAIATGMTSMQRMRIIVLPQALRIIIPPTANEFISMLKTTSLVYVVAGYDLMTNASRIYKQNNLIMELLIVASIWYMVLTAVATYLQGRLEARFGSDPIHRTRRKAFGRVVGPGTEPSMPNPTRNGSLNR
jgi:polar amino acid transport system permease protein